ncbi:conserved hypothetical protein [Leptospira interrogans serovar Copenhageni str. Fiocruz L1-130]|uniref:Uncharacterized protein n=1 Tax=Leptospira interrogans serogroup Icterohaemorrhagiae serovar copenhageni (strain Fiocruz L1-130) TaxID=267671 RepID=Q72VN5_LEPIC|nr:conserved hypothetical protein [Leptospira interrogans serovar Copenhageni str. Fiocruz L1-130]KPA28529.1 Uncharacterized protein AMR48_1443 [Leptospira interrogans]
MFFCEKIIYFRNNCSFGVILFRLTENLSFILWRLEGEKLPEVEKIKGEIKQGEDCGFRFSLSKALENALLNSRYDTILDAEVTHSASMLAPFNCIAVKGFALDSSEIQKENKK